MSRDHMSRDGSELDDYEAANQPQRVNRIDRRAFILSQNNFSALRPVGLHPTDLTSSLGTSSTEHFDLSDHHHRPGMTHLNSHLQRIIQDNQGLLPSTLND